MHPEALSTTGINHTGTVGMRMDPARQARTADLGMKTVHLCGPWDQHLGTAVTIPNQSQNPANGMTTQTPPQMMTIGGSSGKHLIHRN